MNKYIYIHIYQHLKNGKILAPQGLILKKQQSAKVEMFKAKFTFYHVQVNIQVRLTLRFLQGSQQQQHNIFYLNTAGFKANIAYGAV